MQAEHELQKKEMDKELKQLNEQIKVLVEKNKEERKSIEDEAWDQIDMIKEKNTRELALIIEASMASKGNLTEVTGKYKQAQSTKE